MKCQEVNKLLIAYLDNEVTPSERTLIRAHLAGCDICQEELATLSALQSRVSQFLQVRAAQAAPSPQAWSRLQARLAGEARTSPSWLPTWLQRLAPGVGRINQIFEGGITMRKGFALAGALAFALLVVLLGQSITQVPEAGIAATPVVPKEKAAPATPIPPMTLDEAQARVDFPIRLPTYLPQGYQQSAIYDQSEQEKVGVQIFFSFTGSKRKPFDILTMYQGRNMSFLKGGDAVQEVSLKGKPAYWAEYPVMGMPDPGVPPPPYPADATPTVIVGHSLSWEEGGVVYQLRSDAGLPLEEMLKIAESLK